MYPRSDFTVDAPKSYKVGERVFGMFLCGFDRMLQVDIFDN